LFVAGLLLFLGVRLYFHRHAAVEGGRMNDRDLRWSVILRLALAPLLVAVLIGYMVRPSWLGWAALPLPGWASWVGVGLMAVALVSLTWVQLALGANFNTILGIRERHSLVTHGPYRWVRHPMYTFLFVFMLGILLTTANLLIGGSMLIGFVLTIAPRLAREEAILEEAYGEAYRRYKARTGRFWPRLSS
jgi:protein-S-isoprenylcysteine O-methyltransferase Ste14